MADYDLSLTGAQVDAALNKAHSPDAQPINGSSNLVTSGGIYSALDTANIVKHNVADGTTFSSDDNVPTAAAVREHVVQATLDAFPYAVLTSGDLVQNDSTAGENLTNDERYGSPGNYQYTWGRDYEEGTPVTESSTARPLSLHYNPTNNYSIDGNNRLYVATPGLYEIIMSADMRTRKHSGTVNNHTFAGLFIDTNNVGKFINLISTNATDYDTTLKTEFGKSTVFITEPSYIRYRTKFARNTVYRDTKSEINNLVINIRRTVEYQII